MEVMDLSSLQDQKIIEELGKRYGVSNQAVATLSEALSRGNGTMAQFNHPELSGAGQWAAGGMIMIGDMFNNVLKAKVAGLCADLAALLSREPVSQARDTASQMQHQSGGSASGLSSSGSPVDATKARWWGDDLGSPSATGSQNDTRYVYFQGTQRLAVGVGDQVMIYDTEDHIIHGVSQQQSERASMTLVSQHGLVRTSELRIVSRTERHRDSGG